MEVCFGMPSLRNSWTKHNYSAYVPLYATLAPYFGTGLGDLSDSCGKIITHKTNFVMHGSRQNDCTHVRVEGECYNIDVPSYYERPYDVLPVYKFTNGAKTISGNYMFPFSTGVHSVYTTSNDKYIATLVSIDIWEPLVDFGLPAGYFAFQTFGQEVIETISTNYKRFNTWGTYYQSYRSIPIYYYKDGKTNSNSIGKAYGYLKCGINDSNEAYATFTVTSVSRNSWSNMVDTLPVSFNVQRPETSLLFRNNPNRLFYLDYDWDEAMVPALNQVNFFDSNGIAFAHDVAKLPTTILKDLENLKSMTKVSRSGKIKIAASVFLSVHYGYKLLAADGIKLANELLKYQTECTNHLAQTVTPSIGLSERGPYKLASASGHLNVYYNPYTRLCTDIGRFAEAVDLIPDFSNIWDMIPFSFIVDWFTNIGDLASGIDDFFTLTQQSEVLGSITSESVSYTYQPDGFTGNLMVHYYHRSCRPGWYPIPRFSFQLKNPVTDLYHWLESSALVVSKVM